MSNGEIADIDAALEYFWNNYTCTPEIIGMTLKNARAIASKDADADIKRWVEETKDLPENSLVILSSLGETVAIYAPEDADEVMSILLLHKSTKPDGNSHQN